MIERINWSTLKEIAVSPRNFRWRLENPVEDTDALRLGRAVHCLALEGEEALAERYVERGQCAATTQRGNQCSSLGSLYWDGEWYCRKGGHAPPAAGAPPAELEIVTEGQIATARLCAEALRAHPVGGQLLSAGSREQELQWRDPHTGLACRGRVDLIAAQGVPPYLVDLKTTRHATLRAIEQDAQRRLYWGQIAWYLDGAITTGRLPAGAQAYLLAVQTSGPHDVAAWQLGPEALRAGRDLYRELLETYQRCMAADWWPGISPDLLDFEVPWWQQMSGPDPVPAGAASDDEEIF